MKSKEKSKEDKEFVVGVLNTEIAKAIKRRPGEIYLNEQALKHIEEVHLKELKQIGMSVENYVRFILDNFNEIRVGKSLELFFIVNNGLSNVAIVRMNFVKTKYYVETATTMRGAYINKKELIWEERTL